MSPLHSFLALGPLAAYLLVLGVLNLSRRPFLTTGARDLFALGVALTGFLIVGPMDLFIPQRAAAYFGPYIWLLLVACYLLGLTLFVMLVRPRLVIYNLTPDQLRPLLAQIIQRLGLEHQWAGESLALPGLGVQLYLDRFPVMRHVSLVANGAQQSYHGWRRLQQELARELARVEVPPNPIGLSLVTFSLLVFASLAVRLWHNPAAVARSLLDLLRM
jgi:hypothetical protein